MNRKALGRGLEALIRDTRTDSHSSDKVVLSLNVNSIRVNPHQPRRNFPDATLEELKRSIEEKGIIQPLIVRRIKSEIEQYELVVGERRLRAAKLADLEKVPVVLTDIETEEEIIEVALIENIQRENLNAIDQAMAFRVLMEKFGLTQEELSLRIGKDRTTIANTIRLLGLPSKVQKMIIDGLLSSGSARALLPIEDADLQEQLAKRIVREGLSVRKVEALSKKLKGEAKKPSSPKKDNAIIEALTEKLRLHLGTAVSIVEGKKKGKIEIEFYSDRDLERILSLIFDVKPEEILD